MRQLFGRVAVGLGLVVLCAGVAAGQAVPKSIFDDNGDHPFERPDQVQPAPQPQPAPDNSNPTPTPDTSATQPDSTTVTPAPPPPVKAAPIAVPTAEAQQASLKLIDELYKDDIAHATTPALKIELAKKMMETAEGTTDDPVGKYVLLATAKDVAIASGDPPTAFACLDELAEGYRIDYVGMKLDLFAGLAKFVKSPEDQQTYVEGLNHWMDEQVSIDHYDAAKTAGGLAQQVAGRSGDSGLNKTTTAHVKRIGEIAAAFAEVKGALDTLASAPNDPTANLAVGRFYCFIKGDWKRGLPMVALGDDGTLCGLAKQELGGATDADGQVAIGDGWWDQGEKETGSAQEEIRRHAVAWYQLAEPQLAGLAKAKVDKRIGQLATLYPKNSDEGIARKTIINSVGMKLVWIKPGTFMMGSPDGETGHQSDETRHKVTLTKGFFMAVTHVTVGQFAAFVHDSGYRTDAEKAGWADVSIGGKKSHRVNGASWSNPGFVQGTDNPVVLVTCNDAAAFCKWLSKKEGKQYCLPTEAEWEYAERAGTQTAYYFGDDPSSLQNYAWTISNSENHSHPVGQKKPNAWGLYDMTGNAWEWCTDVYAKYPDGEVTDPRGADDGSSGVVRGGAWLDSPESCRAARRRSFGQDHSRVYIGFRVVLDSD